MRGSCQDRTGRSVDDDVAQSVWPNSCGGDEGQDVCSSAGEESVMCTMDACQCNLTSALMNSNSMNMPYDSTRVIPSTLRFITQRGHPSHRYMQ